MPNKQQTPWERDLNANLRSWIACGHESNIPANIQEDITNGMKIEAMIMIQDCNIGGSYYRYFWYKAGVNERYNEVNSRWSFTGCDEGVDQMVVGSVVKLCNQISFRVHEGTGSEFVKLLLPCE